MINLPYIPYIIFGIIMLFGIILGYKRGWRVSLYAAILSIVSFAISYGIFTTFYNQIASLIADKLYDSLGNPSYDWDDILVLGRPIIFTMAISVLYLPVLGLLWLVTFPIYTRLNKKNFPRELKKISENERTIATPSITKNRIIGSLIGTVNATITASIVTSAVAAVFINSASFTSLFSITDTISSMLSGGHLGNSLAYQYLVDFLPYTKDEELMSALSVIIRPNASSLITQSEIDKLNESKHQAVLKNVLSNDESAKALLDTIDQLNTDVVWQPLEHLDDPSYAPVTSALDFLFTDNLKLNLSIKEATNLSSWVLENTMQEFESTRYYIEWFNAEAIRIFAEEELSSREASRDRIVSNIEDDALEYSLSIQELRDDIEEHNSTLRIVPLLEDDKNQKEIISNDEKIIRDNLAITMDSKEVLKDDALTQYNLEIAKYNSYINSRDFYESSYISLDADIVALTSENTTLESELLNLNSTKALREAELSSAQNLESQMDNEYYIANTHWASAESTLNFTSINYQNAISWTAFKRTEWIDAGSPDTGLEKDNYDDAISDELLKKADYDSAVSDEAEKARILVTATENLQDAQDEVSSLESTISILTSEINTTTYRVTFNNSQINSKTTERNSHFSLYEANKSYVITQQGIMDAAENEYDDKNLEYLVAKSAYDVQYSIWDKANNSFISASNLLTSTIARIDELDVNIPNMQIDLDNQYTSLDNQFQQLANINYEETLLSDVTSRLQITVSVSGGFGSDWVDTDTQITKTSYTEDIATYNDSIPYQEDWLEQKIQEEEALIIIRDEKHIEFDDNIIEYIEMLNRILTQA